AMQAIYRDEAQATDEAGAALIKAVGVYSPGALVRLANQEIGVVVRRGANTTMPRVAVLVNPDGIATGEHAIRDTSTRSYRIVAGILPGECKVTIQLDRMLALTAGPAASRRSG
ncbi:MAG: diguanylate cyclase, partial [Burkholderiaceae bacterium]